eukprot:TRINITY_DN12619_c0_g1_i1.p1 TRINITY_DN12619_c0_g1~~TRINITY_DN12619_c0_g1_i1.p1  ORF type:complete len:272 (-),score=24.85 TRINITY_DN12619_c0_g1_i1:196-1011(-)
MPITSGKEPALTNKEEAQSVSDHITQNIPTTSTPLKTTETTLTTTSSLELPISFLILFLFSFILGLLFSYPFFHIFEVHTKFWGSFWALTGVYIFSSWTGWLYHWLLHRPKLTRIFSESHYTWHHRPIWLVRKEGRQEVPELYQAYCLTATAGFWLSFLIFAPIVLAIVACILQGIHLYSTWWFHDFWHSPEGRPRSRVSQAQNQKEAKILPSWAWRMLWRASEIHHVHHLDSQCNYAIYEPIWDMLFGTHISEPLEQMTRGHRVIQLHPE